MNLTPQNEKAILAVIESGVGKSSDKLALMSHTNWQIQTTSFKVGSNVEVFLDPTNYYGAYCSSTGRMFLALYSPQSFQKLTESFLSGTHEKSRIPQIALDAISEISNIMINAVAGEIANVCGMATILSAPKNIYGSKKEIILQASSDFNPAGTIFSAYVHMSSPSIAADCTLMMFLDATTVNFLLNILDSSE